MERIRLNVAIIAYQIINVPDQEISYLITKIPDQDEAWFIAVRFSFSSTITMHSTGCTRRRM